MIIIHANHSFSFSFSEEEERHKKAAFSRGVEPKRPEVIAPSIQPPQLNHVTWADKAQKEPPIQQLCPPAPLPALPPAMPIAVIPISVVPANPTASTLHTASPIPVVTPLATALSPQAAPLLGPAVKDSYPPLQQPQLQHRPLVTQVKAEILPHSGTSPKQQTQAVLQQYSTPVISPHHALLPQPTLAQHQSTVSQLARPNGTTLEDSRSLDAKRRPGG